MSSKDTTGGSDAATVDQTWRYADRAMRWHGWGSPVGAAVFLVGLGGFLALLRLALLGA